METKNMNLPAFIDKLVSEKKEFEGLEPDVITQIKSDLLDRVEDRINSVIVSNIPADKIDAFEKLSDSGTDEEVQNFCEQNIPDLTELIASELIVFRQAYLS